MSFMLFRLLLSIMIPVLNCPVLDLVSYEVNSPLKFNFRSKRLQKSSFQVATNEMLSLPYSKTVKVEDRKCPFAVSWSRYLDNLI